MAVKRILNLPQSSWNLFRGDDRLLLIILGVMVGICSGVAAVALNRALVTMLEALHPLRHHVWAIFIPGAGAMLSYLFLEKVMKEGAGHGVPEVIYSVSRRGGLLRFRSSFTRLVSSCLTIGSGGSAGPEAPVVMSGAAIGSNIARLFSLNERQRITLLAGGAAGAISAIFNAPVAGLIFAMEVILGEWASIHIIPIAIASVAGCEISRMLQGNQTAFSHHHFSIDLPDIIAAIGLAVLCSFSSILLTRMIRNMHDISAKTPLPRWVKPAIGGVAVGGIGIFFPDVMGEGYHAIRSMIEGSYTQGLMLIAVIGFLKIFATALTLGWGGSGGIFAPCLVIGSFMGLTYHRGLVLMFPGVDWVNEGCFALLGMAGLISGILQAPLTGIFLIIEITGSYEVILPLIVVSALSTTLSHSVEPASFYLKDLVMRGQLLRPGTDGRVLADIGIPELLETDCIPVSRSLFLRDLLKVIQKSRRNHFPVEDPETGDYLGMINLDDMRPYFFNPVLYDTVLVEQIMNTDLPCVHPAEDLGTVLQQMDELGLFSMPVVSNGRFKGMISKATILDRYRRELMVQTAH